MLTLNMKISKATVITGSAILTISILIPVFFYWKYFHEQTISTDPISWGVFGDFFGGVLNPIISLGSLIVLASLTYLVATETNKENRNLFYLQQRMAAYDTLVKGLIEINRTSQITSYTREVSLLQSMSEEGLPEPLVSTLKNAKFQEVIDNVNKVKDDVLKVSLTYTEFYITLFNFKLRYGHIFKYDFDSDEFKKLINESKTLSNEASSAYNKMNQANKYDSSKIVFDDFITTLTNVINNLMEEIEAHKKK